MALDQITRDHLEWMGYVQPVGMVVSLPALHEAGATTNRNVLPLHRAFLGTLPKDRDGEPVPALRNFREFAQDVLGWDTALLQEPPEELSAPLPNYGETLRLSHFALTAI
jgi:hypothetical protein